MIVREYDKQTQEYWKRKTKISKSGTFEPSSTPQNPGIGEQLGTADFNYDYSPTNSSNKQYHFQYRSNSYPQHPNPSQSWKSWRETETSGYCFGCG